MKNKEVNFIITPGLIDEVKDLIVAYTKQVKTGIVDYYELFKVSPNMTADALKKSVEMQRLEFMFQERLVAIYGLDAVGQAEYKKLVKALIDFKNTILANENSKKQYDKDLAEAKRASELDTTAPDFAYVPEMLTVDTERKYTAAERTFYKLAEASIALQGASKTVMTLAQVLTDKTKATIPAELKDMVDKLPTNTIAGELAKKHGKKGIVSIVCDELDELFSRKATVLSEAVAITEKHYNKDQTKLAMKLLVEQGLPLAFHRHKDATKGRDKVTMEIKPNMVKYTIAAYMAEDKDLRAMDDPALMATMYLTDDEIDEIVTRMLPKKKLFGGFGK